MQRWCSGHLVAVVAVVVVLVAVVVVVVVVVVVALVVVVVVVAVVNVVKCAAIKLWRGYPNTLLLPKVRNLHLGANPILTTSLIVTLPHIL